MINYETQFGVVDFIIFGASLFASLAIGIYFAYGDREKKTTTNYMYGNKNMSAWPVSISMAVTYISALTILALPVEVYLYGAVSVWFALGSAIGIYLAAQYYVPMYYKLQVNTVFEVFYMGVTIYLPSLAISGVTPLSLEVSILVTTIICTIYTTLGGMKAVIWTDVIQALIMLLGTVSVVVKVTMVLGGPSYVWEAANRGGRNNYFFVTLDPRVRCSLLPILLSAVLFGISSSGTSQPLVQRYISCGNLKVAKRACYYKLIPTAAFSTLACITGICMYAYFEGCDPLQSGIIQKADQSVPLLVVTTFRDIPGFAGLFVASAYSGTLSTVSSGLNSVSTVVVKDYILLFKPNMKESIQLTITKIASLIVGAMVGLVALLCTKFKGTIIRIAFTALSANAGPLFSMFVYAFMPFVSTKGAIGSFVFSIIISWWIAIGTLTYSPDQTIIQKLPLSIDQCNFTTPHMVQSAANHSMAVDEHRPFLADTLYSITPYLIKAIITVPTVIVGAIISLVTGPNKTSEANPDLFIPLFYGKRVPKSVAKFFRFGVPESEDKIEWKRAILMSETEMEEEKKLES